MRTKVVTVLSCVACAPHVLLHLIERIIDWTFLCSFVVVIAIVLVVRCPRWRLAFLEFLTLFVFKILLFTFSCLLLLLFYYVVVVVVAYYIFPNFVLIFPFSLVLICRTMIHICCCMFRLRFVLSLLYLLL